MNDYQHQFKALYLKTSREYIAKLEIDGQKLTGDPSGGKSIDDMYISFHSLASQSLVMGHERLGNFCRMLENVFAEIKAKKLQLSEHLLHIVRQSIEKIRKAIEEHIESDSDMDFSSEQAALAAAATNI